MLPYKLEHDQDKASFREAKSKCLFHVSIDISLETYFLLPHIGAVHLLLEGAAALKNAMWIFYTGRLYWYPTYRKFPRLGFLNPSLTSSNAATSWTGSRSQIMSTISGGSCFRFALATILRLAADQISGTKWIINSMYIVRPC